MEKTHKEPKEKTLPIVREPDKVLRKKAANLAVHDITTPKIQRLLTEMKTTLAETPDGVGLAAPQVGESLRIFIVSEEAEEVDHAEKEKWERPPPPPPPQKKNQTPLGEVCRELFRFHHPGPKNSLTPQACGAGRMPLCTG